MSEDTIKKYMTWPYPGDEQAFISEFFAFFTGLKSDQARVKALRDYATVIYRSPLKFKGLKFFFECMFVPAFKLDLPAGAPNQFPELHDLPDQVPSSLYKVLQSRGYFIKGNQMRIPNDSRREKVFMGFLESMHKGEAHLWLALKDQNYSFIPGLTPEVAFAAFPGWVPPPPKSKNPSQVPAVVKSEKDVLEELKETRITARRGASAAEVLERIKVKESEGPKKRGRKPKNPLAIGGPDSSAQNQTG